MYRPLIRSHSDICTPRAACLIALVAICVALLVGPAVAGTRSAVTPLYEGVGSHYSTRLSNPLGIFFDPVKKECYVADTGNGQVVVFNASGMPVFRFPHLVPGTNGDPTPGEPRSVVASADGTVFLVDAQAPYIDVLDQRGRSITHIDVPDDRCGQPERFIHVALGADRDIYAITACKMPRVVVIAVDGAISRTVVLRTPEPDRACINGFALDPQGRIYITNACADLMVQIYSPDGELIRAFGKHDTGFENFAVPAGLAVTDNGHLWVVDTIRQVVSRFDHEGKLLTMIGGKGSQPGAFEYPSAVATDGESLLFVLERQGSRYQCLRINPEGPAATQN